MTDQRNAEPMSEQPDEGQEVSQEATRAFFEDLRRRGRTPETVKTYKQKLNQLVEMLPPDDKRVHRGTLAEMRDRLLAEGYAPCTVNLFVSACNSFLEFCGHREYQLGRPLPPQKGHQPTLTRSEYLRILGAAKAQGRERSYLLIKAFTTAGLCFHDLERLTLEAAQAGEVENEDGVMMHLPDSYRAELLDYAERKGITTGPLLITRSGTPLSRTAVTAEIQRFAEVADIPADKCNPRCLHRLYVDTMNEIADRMAVFVRQAHDQMLETEQLSIGWKNGK
ncbi:MAG: hypothetical protein LUG92_00700 [Oscillospiraceae bacterium]|nr:hypothetical protein [Oscillospiraceae bacterium]